MGNSSLKTLSEIFNDKIFRIPDYQRGYSWEKDQLNDFWIDLANLDEIRTHYTGMITVEHKKESDFYHVIDGQQRITTIMILLKVLFDRFEDEEWIGNDYGKVKSRYVEQFLYRRIGKELSQVLPIFGYDKDNPSDVFYRSEILELNSTEELYIESNTLYTKNLQFAKDFFIKEIKSLNNEKVEILINKIVRQLKFNFYEIDKNDGLDEFIIFETMNNRGKALTTLELLKNRLIYLTTLLQNDDSEIESLRNDINNVWKTIYQFLGKKSDQKLEDDIFLKYHWRMFFGKYDRDVANPERDFLLKEHFIIQNITNSTINFSDIRDYILNLQKAVVAYYDMYNPNQPKFSDSIKTWLSKINRLGFDTFKPMLMAVLINRGEIQDVDIVDILKLIENYMFIKFKTMKGSNTTIKDFFEYAHEYHTDHDIRGLLRKLDDRIFEDRKNKLFNAKKFNELIKDLYFDKTGWYGWTGLKYLLYEYELHLQNNFKGETKLQWEEINKDSIEHIFPQNSDRECWIELNQLDDENRIRLLHSLGNLVLLSKHHNSKVSNKCFVEKKEVYSSASYSTIEISKKLIWDSDIILERENRILKFMADRWCITFDNEIDTHPTKFHTEDSYDRIITDKKNDNRGQKGKKKKALTFLNENKEYELTNQNMIFSSINKTSGEWWIEPTNAKFENDMNIVLYHDFNKELYIFQVPANSIRNPFESFYQRKNGKPSIAISPYDMNFNDTKKGKISFKDYFAERISIDLDA